MLHHVHLSRNFVYDQQHNSLGGFERFKETSQTETWKEPHMRCEEW